jgi:NAD+ diphosphatase
MMRFSSERSARNTFVAEQIDRAGELREQPEQLLALQLDVDAVELLLSVDLNVATQNHSALYLVSCINAPEWSESRWYLGRAPIAQTGEPRWRHYFARIVEPVDQTLHAPIEYVWSDLRLAGATLAPIEAGFAAFARGLQFWHSKHRFCSVCGSPSVIAHAGHKAAAQNIFRAPMQRLLWQSNLTAQFYWADRLAGRRIATALWLDSSSRVNR